MLLYILNGLYLCVWALLFIHWLNSSRLYPVLGKGFGTKAFWLFTFVFFNPLLTFLYFLCVLCPIMFKHRMPVSENRVNEISVKTNKLMSGLIFVYTCFVIISFEIPRTGLEKQPFMVLSKTDESFAAARKTILTDGLNIGVITAKNKIQTVSSDSSKDNAKVSLHNLILVSKNSNHFLDQIVLKIQKNLVKLPYVDTVAYRNNNQNIVSGEKRPDVFITLETSELSEEKFLLSRKTHVKISCAANNSASDARAASATDSNSYELIVPFTIQTELEHTSRSLCIECPGTEYEQEVKNISCELTEAITKQFENLLKKYEMAPEPAEKLYGTDIIPQLLN